MLLERVEHTDEARDRVAALQQVARIYEEELGDQESAFVVLQAAFREDYAYDPVAKELERLATAAHKWDELLQEYSQIVSGLEAEEPEKAADLWVKIGRWYGDNLANLDYAVYSVQAALRLNPHHTGALTAQADFLRQRQSWPELIEVLREHAAVEPDDERRTALHIQLGELLEMQMQDPLQAIESYRAALESNPASQEALDALDRLYRQNQMWEQLVDVLTRKAETAADLDEQIALQLEIGRLWDDQLQEDGRAIDAYQDVLGLDANNLEALRALEKLYERTGQGEQYLDVLEQQLDASPSEAEKISLYERMAQAWEERFEKLDRAAECFEKIIVLDEGNFDAFRELERLYQQDGKWESLVDTYRRHVLATQERAMQIDLYCAMGQVYEEELSDPDRAIEAYTDVLGIDPDEPRALDALGRLYEQIEDWDRAIDISGRLAETTDDRQHQAELLHRVGRIMDERIGDSTGAEERFLEGLSAVPEHVPTMESLVELYKRRHEWQKAAQMMVRAEKHEQHPLEKVRLLFGAADITHNQLGDTDRATELYAATMAIDPEHVGAGQPLADLYFAAERYAELEPVADMLVRKAPQLRKESHELAMLYFKSAHAAANLGKHDKALKLYKAAYDLDSTHLPIVKGRADLLFRMEDWDGAGKLYQTILVQHRDTQDESEVVDIYYRLGQVRLNLGERKKALNMFEKALQADPNHRPTLEAVIELQSQGGDWEAVIHAKRALLPVADETERFDVLNEIGDLYYDRLQNPQKSIAAYLEALEIDPDRHATLQKVLDRYTETKNWKKAVEIMGRFAELESKSLRRGKYYYAAGVISRDEVKSLDDAVDYFNKALDSYFETADDALADSNYLKAFEAIDKLCTMKRDWKNLERNYRKMIKRLPQRQGDRVLIMLWHNLGEIYRSRLQNYEASAQAFEVATHLDPDNIDRHQILAELYSMSGPDKADKAVETHLLMLRKDPLRIDSYKQLRRIYMDTQQYEKAWCICNALTFLQKADAEEQQFAEQYKPRTVPKAQRPISQDMWKRIYHPDEDRFVSAIFSAVWEGAALHLARPHKSFGVRRKDRALIESEQTVLATTIRYAQQVLQPPILPELYYRDEPVDLVLASISEKNQIIPSWMAGGQIKTGRSPQEVHFIIGREFAYASPEHYLKGQKLPLTLPNNDLRVIFMAALTLVNPKFPVKPELVPAVEQFRPLLQAKIPPHYMENLRKVVQRFIERGDPVDLTRWGDGVEATCHRVGFILCGDLEVSARLASQAPSRVGGPQAKDRVKDLVVYSVSEDYFAIRQQLGVTIG